MLCVMLCYVVMLCCYVMCYVTLLCNVILCYIYMFDSNLQTVNLETFPISDQPSLVYCNI